MGQNEKVEKAPKTSWFSGLKAEFQKIIWPEKQSVIRQTFSFWMAAMLALNFSRGAVGRLSRQAAAGGTAGRGARGAFRGQARPESSFPRNL